MSFIGDLSKYTGYLGRGLEDLFTLGGTEIARRNGGNFGNKVFGVLDKGFGANFEVGAAGGASILGAQGLGAGSGAMTSYAPTSTPVMSQAGSTLGGGMGSSMNLAPAYGSATGPAGGMAGASSGMNPMTAARLISSMRGNDQQPQGQTADQMMERIYNMLPQLRSRLGGQHGY